MASRTIFITGTDTDAGKTWVTASVIRAMLADGVNACALKPIACGADAAGLYADVEALLAVQGIDDIDAINCYRFAKPAAPSQAAAAEDTAIDQERLVQWCRDQAANTDTCLIEGVGGLMVPVTAEWLVSDWIAAMPECEVWLVVACRLGAINQTLLTLDKLKAMGREPSRIFFNAIEPEYDVWIEPTRSAVAPFIDRGCTVHSVPFGSWPEQESFANR